MLDNSLDGLSQRLLMIDEFWRKVYRSVTEETYNLLVNDAEGEEEQNAICLLKQL